MMKCVEAEMLGGKNRSFPVSKIAIGTCQEIATNCKIRNLYCEAKRRRRRRKRRRRRRAT